jgi:GMP reductase
MYKTYYSYSYQDIFQTYYSYQDIFLKPQYSKYHSRSEADVSVKLGNKTFTTPVIPANMKCTIDQRLALWMSENDYFYVMHRFNANHYDTPNTDNINFIEKANEDKWKNISISLGVKDEDKDLIEHCIKKNLRIDYITIDIAHAHSVRMKEMLAYITRMYRSDICSVEKPFIIAGNVATPAAVVDLENWGADAVKVGIAAGKACRTFNETGFGVPMFSCVKECSYAAKKPIIADGGISECGDIVKALVAGATMTMAGGMFAACIDSPADTVVKIFKTNELRENTKINAQGVIQSGIEEILAKKTYKTYFGSASEKNKGANTHIEGTTVEIECNKKTYAQRLKELEEGIQSAVSYSGGDLKSVEWGVRNSQKL